MIILLLEIKHEQNESLTKTRRQNEYTSLSEILRIEKNSSSPPKKSNSYFALVYGKAEGSFPMLPSSCNRLSDPCFRLILFMFHVLVLSQKCNVFLMKLNDSARLLINTEMTSWGNTKIISFPPILSNFPIHCRLTGTHATLCTRPRILV